MLISHGSILRHGFLAQAIPLAAVLFAGYVLGLLLSN